MARRVMRLTDPSLTRVTLDPTLLRPAVGSFASKRSCDVPPSHLSRDATPAISSGGATLSGLPCDATRSSLSRDATPPRLSCGATSSKLSGDATRLSLARDVTPSRLYWSATSSILSADATRMSSRDASSSKLSGDAAPSKPDSAAHFDQERSRGARPRVGISACLLGRVVRYDGASKEERFLSEALTPHIEWVPVCPEVEIGLGVPRPRIDLTVATRTGDLPHMMQEGIDLTPRMVAYSENKIGELTTTPLAAYVFKARSPSCGLGGVKQIHEDGIVREDGVGIFASEFARKAPQVLRFEESAFSEPESREAAMTAIFTLARWYAKNSLSEFHRQHRNVVLARGFTYLSELDRIVTATDSGVSPSEEPSDEQFGYAGPGNERSRDGSVGSGGVDERSTDSSVGSGSVADRSTADNGAYDERSTDASVGSSAVAERNTEVSVRNEQNTDEPPNSGPVAAQSKDALAGCGPCEERSADQKSSRTSADAQYLRTLIAALHRVPTRDDHLRALTSVIEAFGEPHGREARERHVVATHLVDRFRQGAASLGEVLAQLRDLLELRGPIHDVYFEPHPPELRLLFSIH